MGIGYVQGGTRPMGGHAEAGELSRMDSGFLWTWGRIHPEEPGKATQSHIDATSKRVDSQGIATLKPS
jgi:hypothetical protein